MRGRKFQEIYILGLIFILALSLRVAYLNEVNKSPLSYLPATGLDDALYHRWAKDIAGGNWLGKEAFSAMPVYPYFLGLIYKISGANILLAKIIQFILGALSCILIYLIAQKIFGQTNAVISALLACVYGPFIFYEEILVATSLTIFLYLVTFFSLLWALDAPSRKRFFLFALLAGLASLTAANMLLFIPVVIVGLWLKYKPPKTALLYISCIILGLFLVIAPVTLRNYLAAKDFIPIVAHGGINFYIGNNEEAGGLFTTPLELGGTPEGLRLNSQVVAEKLMQKKLKPSEVSWFWFTQGVNFIKARPEKFFYLLGRKLLLFINFYEIPDVRDYQFYQKEFGLLKILFGFNLVAIFSVLGLLLSPRRSFKAALLKWFILSYLISVILFFVNSRYRLPIVPFLIILAGAGLSGYIQIIKERRYQKALLCVLPIIIVFGLSRMKLVPRSFAGSYNLLGLSYLEQGAYRQAIAQFEQASSDETQEDIAYFNLGEAWMRLGDYASSLKYFGLALDKNPYLYTSFNERGNIYLALNKIDEAYQQFTRALEINPNYAQAHANLGLVYRKKGMWDSAIREYQQALALDASLTAEIYNNLGLVYLDQGELEKASAYFQEAIKLNPQLACAYYNLGLVWAKKGQATQAKNLWQKTLELDPGFVAAEERLKNLKKPLY